MAIPTPKVSWKLDEASGDYIDQLLGTVITTDGETPGISVRGAGKGFSTDGVSDKPRMKNNVDPVNYISSGKVGFTVGLSIRVDETLFGALIVQKTAMDKYFGISGWASNNLLLQCGDNSTTTTNGSFLQGVTYHVILVCDEEEPTGREIRGYINGDLETIAVQSIVNFGTDNKNVRFGNTNSGNSAVTIGHYEVWEEVLTAAQVTELWNGGLYKSYDSVTDSFIPTAIEDDLKINFGFENQSGNDTDDIAAITLTNSGAGLFDNLADAGAGHLFDGVSDEASYTDAADPIDYAKALTYRATVRVEAGGSLNVLVHKGDDIQIYLKTTTKELRVVCKNNIDIDPAESDAPLVDETDYDLWIVIDDDGLMTMFLDDTAQAITGTRGTKPVTTNDVFICSSNGANNFNATVAAISVWQKVLSDVEISDLHNSATYKTYSPSMAKFQPPRIDTNLRSAWVPDTSLTVDQQQGFSYVAVSTASQVYGLPWTTSRHGTVASSRVAAPNNLVFTLNSSSSNGDWTIRIVGVVETNGSTEILVELKQGVAVFFLVKDNVNRLRPAALGSATTDMDTSDFDNEAEYVFVKKGTNVDCFRNRILDVSLTTTLSASDTTMTMTILNNSGFASGSAANIAEVDVWGRALSTLEVTTIFDRKWNGSNFEAQPPLEALIAKSLLSKPGWLGISR